MTAPPGRQALLVFFSLILLSFQEWEGKDGSERDGRLAHQEGSDGLRHKNNNDQLAESHLGMKSENWKKNTKAEKTKRFKREMGKDIKKKKRKSPLKPKHDKLLEFVIISVLTR